MRPVWKTVLEYFNRIRYWEKPINFTIGSFVLVFNPEDFNEVLLVHHNYKQKKWSFPGGGPQFAGEPFPVTAKREAKAEEKAAATAEAKK